MGDRKQEYAVDMGIYLYSWDAYILIYYSDYTVCKVTQQGFI